MTGRGRGLWRSERSRTGRCPVATPKARSDTVPRKVQRNLLAVSGAPRESPTLPAQVGVTPLALLTAPTLGFERGAPWRGILSVAPKAFVLLAAR